MKRSRASLEVTAVAGETRLVRAAAESPQRWTVTPDAGGGLEAVHQTTGDGIFGGDAHRTRIIVGAGARLTVRSVSATSLRGPTASLVSVRAHVAHGGTLIYLPGALVPHREADHTSSLVVTAEAAACVLVATIVTQGRAGMGERGAFRRLRTRNIVRQAGVTVLAEDASLDGCVSTIGGTALFAGSQAALFVTAAGSWPAASPDWWAGRGFDHVTGAPSALRVGPGVAYRGLCASLGAAMAALARLEGDLRVCDSPA